MEKIIISFTGLIACGKGTATEYLKNKYQAETFRFSTMLRDVLDRLYLEHSRDNLSGMSTALRDIFGQDLMAKVIAEDVKRSVAPMIVVEGIRRQPDIKYLRELPNFFLVSIEADEKIRYQRLVGRGENSDDSSKTWEEFLQDHQKETEITIPETMKQADYIITNNGSQLELQRQLDELIVKINNGSKN